jgi:hypothetical protein
MTGAALPPGFDPRTTMVPPPWLLPWSPWLQLTQSALDAWVGLWAAALPQHQAELVLQVQRQALDAWTTPLAWAAPPAEPPAPPAPHPPRVAIPVAMPVEAPHPRAAAPANPEPEMREPNAEDTVSAEAIAPARPEPAPARKAVKPAPEVHQPGARKALPQAGRQRPTTRR